LDIASTGGLDLDPLRRRPFWGAKMGVAVMAVLLVIRSVSAGFEPSALVTYLVSGAVAGLLVGFCLPYTRSRLGSSVVGIVAISPILVAQASFEGLEWWVYAITAICVGGFAGYGIRDQVFKELDHPASDTRSSSQ
jgi:hypothetical protein